MPQDETPKLNPGNIGVQISKSGVGTYFSLPFTIDEHPEKSTIETLGVYGFIYSMLMFTSKY